MKLRTLDIPDKAKTDIGLKHYLAAGGPRTTLTFTGWEITDAGLVHLEGLTSLQRLAIDKTRITDAGMAQLANLTGLQELKLTGCRNITDAALVHLKRLAELQTLLLGGTSITDRGIAELQQALPNCFITK